MKHIKEAYGRPCNHIESTVEEFYMMKEFLKIYGVEARMIVSCDGICEWQIRNGYKDWVHLNRQDKIAQSIIKTVEENIKNNSYAR